MLTTTEPPQKRHSTKCGMSAAVVLVLASPARVDLQSGAIARRMSRCG